jgi:hypothetical protein
MQNLRLPGPSPETPESHQPKLAELLEQLANESATCAVCKEQISRFEMFVAWPLAGLLAHIQCYREPLGGAA